MGITFDNRTPRPLTTVGKSSAASWYVILYEPARLTTKRTARSMVTVSSPVSPTRANVNASIPAHAMKHTFGHLRPTESRQNMVNAFIGSSNAADIEYAG